MIQDIRVEIYGQVYSIRTDLNPDYIRQLAHTVDAKMRALGRQSGTVDTRRLAILTALNLADELQQLQNNAATEPQPLAAEFIERLEQCNRLLDAALNGGPETQG
jgi:cell division protein ZapA